MKINNSDNLCLLLLLIVTISLPSCKKSPKKPDQEAFTAVKTIKGATIGDAIKKTIGAEGGSFSLPDGSITINIPAGALTNNTEFSIQEIEKNLAISTGRVYRFLPENLTFKKPVDVVLKYSDSDTDGTTSDFLYLVYQDNQGFWHPLINSTVNPSSRSLKVTTTHFSDWSLIREVHLSSSKKELAAGEECTLSTYIHDYSMNDLLGENKPVRSNQVVSWKVINGVGSITGGNNASVTYKAPASIDKSATAIIELTLQNLVSKSNPSRPGKSGMVIIRKELTLLPNEFIKWTASGIEHNSIFYSAGVFNGETIIATTSTSGGLSINLNGAKEGTYDLGDMQKPSKAAITLTQDNKNYISSYTECSTGKRIYANGSITITKFEDKPNGIIEGHFSATPYNYTNCTQTNRKTEGSFKILRGN
ncbi:DUF6252 family protein [Pedobacter panaciterrae]|uniref:DUF6252 family protein n=1 Tax=Pedobacter panaciterrae TaxID=363849 RepID=UPI002596762A|nr:DUF6252 family protein [uncultured Pedobacter sp.]